MGTWKIFSFHLPKGFWEEETEKQVSHFVDTWWKTQEKNGKQLTAGPGTGFSYLLEGIACDLQQGRKPGPASCAQVWREAQPAAPSHTVLLWKGNKERRICPGLTGKAGSTGIRLRVFCRDERDVSRQCRLSAVDGGQPKQPGDTAMPPLAAGGGKEKRWAGTGHQLPHPGSPSWSPACCPAAPGRGGPLPSSRGVGKRPAGLRGATQRKSRCWAFLYLGSFLSPFNNTSFIKPKRLLVATEDF